MRQRLLFPLRRWFATGGQELELSLAKLRDSFEDCGVYAWLLRRCTDVAQGRRIHAHIVRSCTVSRFLSNSLIQMYGSCGAVAEARDVFDGIPRPNVFSWTLMVAAYARCGHYEQAVDFFLGMERLDPRQRPDKVAFVAALDACATILDLKRGKATHAFAVRCGLDTNALVATGLVKVYSRCGRTAEARRTFDSIAEKDLVAWNAMLAAYAHNGHSREALKLFKEMQLEGLKVDRVSLVSLADACTDLREAGAIHTRVIECGLEGDIVLGNSLVNMFGKCSEANQSKSVFDRLGCSRDVITWTAMMAAYTQNGHGKEALQLFREMDAEGIPANSVTFVAALDACSWIASSAQGKLIHQCIVESSSTRSSNQETTMLNSALVNMYGKCGQLQQARGIFDTMQHRNAIVWTALIAAHAQNGHPHPALELFNEMQLEGVMPDHVTFVSVYYGCSHSGSLARGMEIFASMQADYGLQPTAEHYKGMVDVLARAGWFDLAEELVATMPRDTVAWMTLLGACLIHSDVQRAERYANRVTELDPSSAGHYVLLSRVYASVGRLADAARIREAMDAKRLKKKDPGCSWVVVKNRLHEFFANAMNHPATQRIHQMLERLRQEVGEVSSKEEAEREEMLCYHSEKLAVAFGIVSTASKTSLEIGKNLRICHDCHAWLKVVSKVTQRTIVVRDISRFHRVENGVCSCGDYW